jgi:hypothetical protein
MVHPLGLDSTLAERNNTAAALAYGYVNRRVWSDVMAKSRYKVIPLKVQDEVEDWEAAMNKAAEDGWELFSTVNRGEVPLAVMRRDVRSKVRVVT